MDFIDLDETRAVLISAAREAGMIGLKFFRTADVRPVLKPDQSPVTIADRAIDAYLVGRLKSVCSDAGWLSEESVNSHDRSSSRRMWVVDPIDGTRSFVAGGDEWVVSLALVQDGRPIIAALFRPATGDLYDATLHGGARLNGRRLSVSDGLLESIRTFTGPQKILQALAAEMPQAAWFRASRSLALRLAQLAEGVIDTALVKAGAHDWDIAAADLILSEAGGCLTTRDGARPVYNGPSMRHAELIGAGPRRHAAFLSACREGRLSFS